MKLVAQVRLLPTPMQAALEATLRACNEAATWVSEIAFEAGEFKNFALRKLTYEQVKSHWGLGAQAAQHVVKKTCDAYATLRANLKGGRLGRPGSARYRRATEKPVAFRPCGAQPFDDRMLSWQIAERTVSLWTSGGRMKNVAFTASPEQLATLALYRKGESDLICRNGMWFLHATCAHAPLQTPEEEHFVRQAPTEEAEPQGGAAGQGHQPQDRDACGRGNGGTSRASAAERGGAPVAESPSKISRASASGYGFESLGAPPTPLRQWGRATHSSWAFAQLRQFIAYKARKAGVPVVYVDPAYTSRTCAECGHIDRANRVSQAWFACRSCGFVDHADRWGHLPLERSRERGKLPQHSRTRVGVVATRGPVNGPCPTPASAGRGWTQTGHHRQ
ncbi:transposase [Streptomyces sp. L2]|uniref:transposase n=1 Tax=Streptomyces sp. L2 TaxID=2162665 RepID=UPI001F513A62|nr:transposase [Streptomyces sp. L2]